MNIPAAPYQDSELDAPTNRHAIWAGPDNGGRNQVVFFRKSFDLTTVPTSVPFSVFADTRYRLIVNGQTLGHGPARFHATHPEYDSYDLAPHLRTGENVVAVIVHHMGRETAANQASRGGLMAAGQVAETSISLASDSGWKTLLATAYKSDTIRISNQLGFHEWLDARELPGDWTSPGFDASSWPEATILGSPSHWGNPLPRSIPPLDESEIEPANLLGTFTAKQTEPQQQIAALRVILDSDWGWPLQTIPVAFQTYLYSSREQTFTLGASAPMGWINGQLLEPQPRSDLVWRHDYTVTLQAGWSSLLLLDQRIGDAIEIAIQWPSDTELTLNAERNMEGPSTFRVGSKPIEEEAPVSVNLEGNPDISFVSKPLEFPTPALLQALANSDFETVSAETASWSLLNTESQLPSPSAARAWKKLVPLNEAAQNVTQKTLLFDFEAEVLGRPRLEFTAAAGTVVDVLYTERLRDGVAHHGMQGSRMGERYVAREGRQVWYLLQPRGMRYLEVVIRGDLSRFELHRLSLTRANYPVREIGSFQCSDPILNDIWRVGKDTLYACMEDAYIDCPWRERGLYIGDLLTQFYTNLATFGDHALMRRCIVQLFETQDEKTGLLACVSHSLQPGLLPDYSAIAIQVVWHYWARTADIDFVRQLEPQLRLLLRGLQQIEVPDLNLLDTTGRNPYIDLSHGDTDGISCAANCFQQRAYADGARLLNLLGDEAAATHWEQHAEAMATAIRTTFWAADQNVFLDRRREDVPAPGPSAPGNILALLYGIATPEQVPGALHYLVTALANNQRVPDPQLTADLNLTSYFAFYGLQALYDQGQDLAAEGFIRDNWNRMLEAGAVTWWEYFIDRWSLCHAWSASPTHFLSTQVLGVRYSKPGDPDEILINPQPGSLQWAEGVYPHPRGPISVTWKRDGTEIVLNYEVPDGVRVVKA